MISSSEKVAKGDGGGVDLVNCKEIGVPVEFVRSGTKATKVTGPYGARDRFGSGVRDDGGRFGTEGESVEKREKRERRKQVEEERKRKDKRTRIEDGAGEKAAEAIGGALPPPGGLVPFAPTAMGEKAGEAILGALVPWMGWDVSQDLQEARCTMQRIRKLNYSQFSEEGVITELPFPALERAPVGERPGAVINYVGRRQVYPRALQMVLTRVVAYDRIVEQYRGVIITGPSGSGKSCLLRALTCQLIATLPKAVKIICFWYFDASGDMKQQVQDALLFAYCEECDVEPGLAERILKIDSVESLKTFLRHRKSKREMLYLVTDGEERLDRVTSEGTERIDSQAKGAAIDRKWLYTFYAYADFELKALSPKAEAAALSASSQCRLLHRLELT